MTKISTIITLLIIATAGASEAQVQTQPELPQYLPPSYHSPHGGTGLSDFNIKPPKNEWPEPAVPQDQIVRPGVDPSNYTEFNRLQADIAAADTPEKKEAANQAMMKYFDREAEKLRRNMKAWDDIIYNRKGR